MKAIFSVLIDSIFAGVVISVGCVVSLAVGGGIPGAFLFSIGLLAICVMQFSLFTGKVCYAKLLDTPKILLILAGNLAGTIGMAYLIRFLRPELIEPAAALAAKKLQESWRVIPLGMLCNMLIFLAVDGFRKEEHKIAGTLLLVLCVMGFILSGSEHSIANSFYLTLAGRLPEGQTLLYLWLNIVGNAIGGLLTYRLVEYARKIREKKS